MITKVNNLVFEGVTPPIDEINMGGGLIRGHGTPLVGTDVVNKAYVDAAGGTFTTAASNTDTTPATLLDKLVEDENIGFLLVNGGGNEQIEVSVPSSQNFLINGDFDFWQRDTTFAIGVGSGSYTADRWISGAGDAGTFAATVSRGTFSGTGNPSTPPAYYLDWTIATSTGGTTVTPFVAQYIEDVRTAAERTITISFWARSPSSMAISVNMVQDFGSGGSADVTVAAGSAATSSAWQFFSFTINLSTIQGLTVGTDSSLRLVLGAPLNTTGTIQLAKMQVVRGRRRTTTQRPRAEEFAQCQRFFQKTYSVDDPIGTITGEDQGLQAYVDGGGTGTFGVNGATFHFKTEMRAEPTITLYNPNTGATGSWTSGTTVTLAGSAKTPTTGHVNVVISGATPAAENFHIHVVADAEIT